MPDRSSKFGKSNRSINANMGFCSTSIKDQPGIPPSCGSRSTVVAGGNKCRARFKKGRCRPPYRHPFTSGVAQSRPTDISVSLVAYTLSSAEDDAGRAPLLRGPAARTAALQGPTSLLANAQHALTGNNINGKTSSIPAA
ncbi:unnamed protein product [Acanthoscelides obtectus]|uniref:Uncharacterized protein n=1 Tax=Acanthoscelides obtectus TaxID=200917 RepID=A0A9P0M0C3_ACAOB|nr:unnamed protein product [Acanthoscelides obtectus]CAK1637526.1 hypothetical protein AOBTE_LOCUS10023 [Acanthoscelides obtectus]